MTSPIKELDKPETLFCSPFWDKEYNIERLSNNSFDKSDLDSDKGSLKRTRKSSKSKVDNGDSISNIKSEATPSISSQPNRVKKRAKKEGTVILLWRHLFKIITILAARISE